MGLHLRRVYKIGLLREKKQVRFFVVFLQDENDLQAVEMKAAFDVKTYAIKSVTIFEQLSIVCLPDPPVNRF
jgi:hypothetical protein